MSGKAGRSQAQQSSQPPKYLNDFSKALANEVRILLQEVGQLRDERRQLQYEIAELMAVKSKHGAGGEYNPDWKPQGPPPEEPPPPPPPEEALPPAKPAWRTVNIRQERKERTAKSKGALPPPPPPPPAPAPELPAWAQWKPANAVYAPVPLPGIAPAPKPSPRPQGLFGPRTPPPQ
ncbi:hypothetical protein BD410DRAFT_893997 [Rickenella mellea]|uniref:Uncharacterized protein n=1 Tax=Rickenella mellea TaxID=50990 RepID=A0A4Y7QKP3_9AGAM|nr:hypothetical protein BD410DRAFT_893997 [Rickenella mellea]